MTILINPFLQIKGTTYGITSLSFHVIFSFTLLSQGTKKPECCLLHTMASAAEEGKRRRVNYQLSIVASQFIKGLPAEWRS
jgi:hypothetical protein